MGYAVVSRMVRLKYQYAFRCIAKRASGMPIQLKIRPQAHVRGIYVNPKGFLVNPPRHGQMRPQEISADLVRGDEHACKKDWNCRDRRAVRRVRG